MNTKMWSLLISTFALVVLMSHQASTVFVQKVVAMPTFSLSQLRAYSLNYFQNEEEITSDKGVFTANADSTSFQYQQEFMVYNRTFLKHPVGAITYRAAIDLKDEKLRFTTDSIYFQHYVRNRYSRYVPESTLPIPLSEWQQQWSGREDERYSEQIQTSMEKHLQAFVDYLQKQKDSQVNAVQLDNW